MFIYLIGKREKEKDINGKNREISRERGVVTWLNSICAQSRFALLSLYYYYLDYIYLKRTLNLT